MKYLVWFSLIIILIGCHELPEPKLIYYYILNNNSNDSSFNYFDKNLNIMINTKGYGFVFTKGEWGVLFSNVVVSINNYGVNNLQVSYTNLELHSNYYRYSLIDTLQEFELKPNENKESKFLFRSSNNDNVTEVPMNDTLRLKLKLFVEGNNLDLPIVILSPRKKS